MRFKFENGNKSCSVEGQTFAANSLGVFTIPDALAPRVVADWGREITTDNADDAPVAIEDMSREQLIETILADGRAHLATPSIEELRAMALRTRPAKDARDPKAADDDKLPAGFDPAAPLADEDVATMPRAELFAVLKDRGVKTDGKMSNDELRALAHDAINRLRPSTK